MAQIESSLGKRIAYLINQREVADLMMRAMTRIQPFDPAAHARWLASQTEATSELRLMGIPVSN